MASNHTEHFSLNQWLPDDQVKHTDFNADNAKIDAALGAMAPQLAMLARAVPNLAFYEGQEGIRRLLKGERHPAQRSMLCEVFRDKSLYTITGSSVFVESSGIRLSGAGRTGQVKWRNLYLSHSTWTHAKMWLHKDGGTVDVTLNGVAMPLVHRERLPKEEGIFCDQCEYAVDLPGENGAHISLDLTCGEEGELHLYDACIFFF